MKSGMSSRIIAKLIKNMTDQELLAFIVATTKELERRSGLGAEAILSTADALLQVKEK